MCLCICIVQDDKKAELTGKTDRARDAVAKLTSAIEQMRVSRDEKMADINRLQQKIEVYLHCIKETAVYFSYTLCLEKRCHFILAITLQNLNVCVKL